MKSNMNNDELYVNRLMSEFHPDIDDKDFKTHMSSKNKNDLYKYSKDKERIDRWLKYLGRLVPIDYSKRFLIVGCGLRPNTISILIDNNYLNIKGIEPVSEFVCSAADFLKKKDIVLQGSLERLPFNNESQDIIFCESVMEHVDSPSKSLHEMNRVLSPGGIVIISTTNRYKLSFFGKNSEYTIRWFNFLPDILKECYIFHQQQYKPEIAAYTGRPAVHWYTYSDLCKIGREAGFSNFYSLIDLVRVEDESISKSKLRRFFTKKIQLNPLMRALYLSQYGGLIIMYKRKNM